MSRCPHCPVATDLRCPGESSRRLCQLIDPADAIYRPDYRASILSAAEQMAHPTVDEILAEAKAEGIPESTPPFNPCGSC